MDKFLLYIILFLPVLVYTQSNFCPTKDTTLCYNEYMYPSGFPIVMEKKWESEDTLSLYQTPFCYLDENCNPRLTSTTSYSDFVRQNTLNFVNPSNGVSEDSFFIFGTYYGRSSCLAIADVDENGSKEVFIISSNTIFIPDSIRRKIVCFDEEGNIQWVSDEVFHQYEITNLAITDFNNDGTPELYASNRIFNSTNGVLLADGGFNGYGLRINTNAYAIAANFDTSDQELELAAGYTIYDVEINNLNGTSDNSLTPHNITVNGQLLDGYTSAADINGDGVLDVIVVARISDVLTTVYAYSYLNGIPTLLAKINLPTPALSPPLIKSDASNRFPSIIASGIDGVYALRYNNTTTFERLWTYPNDPFIYGLTAYDLNNDGYTEVIFRDFTDVNVLETKNDIPNLVASHPCIAKFPTNELPIIADIDKTGQAKICVPCGEDYNSKLFAFGSPDTLPAWTPARRIWNQHNYHVLNINEDGTVPQYMENNATYENGRYNNFYQQATVLDSNGMYRQPAAGLYGEIECVQYEPTTQTYTVTFDLFNRSDASRGADAGLPISFYDGDPETDGTLLGTYLTTLSINPNDMLNDLTYSFTASELDQLFMVVNTEKNANGSLQEEDFIHPECDYTDNIAHYTNLPTIDQQTAEICEGTSYDFYGDMLDAQGNYYHHILDVKGCDSVVVALELDVVDTVQIQSMDVVCDTLIWNGDVLTESGNYQFRTQNAQGCDSIVNLDLTIYKSEKITATQIACDSFAWNGEVYSVSGEYTYATQSFYGCDSTTFLDLTIHPSYDIDLIQQACDSFEWNGDVYRSDGVYTYQSVSQFGCDSIVTLELTINDVLESEETAVSCDSFIWNGTSYDQSGEYSFETQSVQGCDSIAQLTLDIYYATSSTLLETACDSFLWDGNIYDQSGTYQFEGVTTRGCDSLVVLDLDILQSTTSYDQVSACDSFIWNGMVYDQSGTYDYTIQNAVGCDSVATINLILSKSTTEMTLEKACDSITWNGQTYTQDGLYNYSSTNALGCDSTVLLELTINRSKSINLNESVCDSLIYQGEVLKNTGDYVYELQTNEGCDSIINLSVSILSNSNEEKIEACDEYKWPKNGENYTNSGQYEVRYTNSLGCDSIEILTLDIYESYEFLTVEEACNTYTWTVNDEEISETGIYTYDLQSSKGCDSTYVLDLIINSEFEDTDTVMTSNEFTWLVNGITYTTSGTYSASYINQNNCDSTHILLLTIDNTIEVYAPNIIRPGSNTFFTIFGNDGITTIDELSIYDRWGNQVFNAQNIPPNQPELGWNGTVNGRLVNSGVYVWHAVISTTEGKVIERTGDITVIR